ncbi:MAG: hypothetical protein ACO31I_15320, partial [Prochlorotrichaceae cyanobacterium]
MTAAIFSSPLSLSRSFSKLLVDSIRTSTAQIAHLQWLLIPSFQHSKKTGFPLKAKKFNGRVGG